MHGKADAACALHCASLFYLQEMWQQRCELMSCTAGAVQGQHKRERAREQRKQRARARWLQDAVCGITLLPPCFLKGVGYLHRPIMEKNSPAARSQSRFSQGSGAARPESATPPSASTPVTLGWGVAIPGSRQSMLGAVLLALQRRRRQRSRATQLLRHL